MAAPWSFRTDVNADGRVDVSDLGLALIDLLLLPGDSLIYLIISFPALAGMAGVSAKAMGGSGAVLISILFWTSLIWLILKIRKKAKGLPSTT